MASALDIYNRALARIGIDQFLGESQETSKAGTLFRMWYDASRRSCLRDFPWNFAARMVALAVLDGDPRPGWAFKYGYPTDCLQACTVCDSFGARTTLTGYLYGAYVDDVMRPRLPNIGVQKMPFVVASEALSPTSSHRIILTDQPNAYLLYTADVIDPTQFDAGFADALEWLIASEIAGPFLGAPTGMQVAAQCGKYYANAVENARAQNLNEAAPDVRPDSPAVSARL